VAIADDAYRLARTLGIEGLAVTVPLSRTELPTDDTGRHQSMLCPPLCNGSQESLLQVAAAAGAPAFLGDAALG
jgi:hypothetical protein